jgi:type VI secretion system secreted protein VgrG
VGANGAGGEATYHNTFDCIPSSTPFRPARVTPTPFIQGCQTALVVGPAGEEIYTEKYGRIKVQFHWDRLGKKDENSSCWIRVSHPWAGKGYGSVSIPRIGQEVIVDFLEGNPDQPIIVGRVYNAEQMPPNGLPKEGMVSGIKSNSTPGGGGYNEMTMDDTKGKEKITVHAQYDMSTTVEHDQTTTVHNNRTDAVDVNDSETIGNNQSIKIGSDQTLSVGANQKNSIGASRTTTVGANDQETISSNQIIAVGGNQTVSTGSNQSVTVGAARTVGVTGADSLTVGAGQTISVSGPVTITSGASITLSAGGSSIVLGSGGITLNTGGVVTVTASVIKHNA